MKTRTEQLNVTLGNGVKDIWLIPFRWYKYRWGHSYEPVRSFRTILAGLQEWRRITNDVPDLS